jgi:hypothetical protein
METDQMTKTKEIPATEPETSISTAAPATEPETSISTAAPATEPETSISTAAPATEPETSTDTAAPATEPENPGATVSPEADAAPEVTETQLRALLVKVETGNNDMQRAALLDDLRKVDGLVFERDVEDEANGRMKMILAGVIIDLPDSQSPRIALDNWCNAARRKIMSGELPA